MITFLLTGFPIKEYEIINENNETQWLSNDIIQTISNCADIKFTGKSRMGYAPPAWLPTEFNPNGTIIFADDWNRCNTMVAAAVMEIINEGAYVSWKLPKYTTLALSANPDNGNFQVTSMDSAILSRYNSPVIGV